MFCNVCYRAHWKFLKTVVNKLFEFMHETHDGVQDMACDTFIKIAQKCRRHFIQVSSERPHIRTIWNSRKRCVHYKTRKFCVHSDVLVWWSLPNNNESGSCWWFVILMIITNLPQVQPLEVMPFIEEILNNIRAIIMDLQPQQVHTFYEAVGYMIQAQVVSAWAELLGYYQSHSSLVG